MKKIIALLACVASLCLATQRLVVLDPASIEIIYMLGAGESIKGIASLQHSNIYPEEQTSKLTSVGSFSNPSIEKILALKPTLVVVSSYSIALEPRLKELGIKTLYLEATRLDDMYKNITTLAKLLGKEKEGKELIAKTKSELEALKKEPLNKRAIFLFSSNPLMAFSQNSMMADILQIIGVTNLTPPSDIQRPIITSEFIVRQNPNLILISLQATSTQTLIDENPSLKATQAFKDNNIFFYDKVHRLMRISPTIPEHIKAFKATLIEQMQKNK